MNIDQQLFDFSKSAGNRSFVERFNDKWFFDMPESGIVIYKNSLIFNELFLNIHGFSLLNKLIEHGMIFAYDKTNTEKIKQMQNIEELNAFFIETPDYQKYRYMYAQKTNSIFADFLGMLTYKKIHKMNLTND